MTMTDPIADMLTRIRNANISNKEQVDIPASRMKERIAKILKKEGFIKDYRIVTIKSHNWMRIFLKYGANKEKVITGLKRISKPGLRVYVGKDEIPRILGGMGIVILSTSKGVLTGKQAQKIGVGGEVLCYVW